MGRKGLSVSLPLSARQPCILNPAYRPSRRDSRTYFRRLVCVAMESAPRKPQPHGKASVSTRFKIHTDHIPAQPADPWRLVLLACHRVRRVRQRDDNASSQFTLGPRNFRQSKEPLRRATTNDGRRQMDSLQLCSLPSPEQCGCNTTTAAPLQAVESGLRELQYTPQVAGG